MSIIIDRNCCSKRWRSVKRSYRRSGVRNSSCFRLRIVIRRVSSLVSTEISIFPLQLFFVFRILLEIDILFSNTIFTSHCPYSPNRLRYLTDSRNEGVLYFLITVSAGFSKKASHEIWFGCNRRWWDVHSFLFHGLLIPEIPILQLGASLLIKFVSVWRGCM